MNTPHSGPAGSHDRDYADDGASSQCSFLGDPTWRAVLGHGDLYQWPGQAPARPWWDSLSYVRNVIVHGDNHRWALEAPARPWGTRSYALNAAIVREAHRLFLLLHVE